MEHPENLDEVNSLDIDGEVRSIVTELASDIESEKSKRVNIDTTIDRLDRLRYGVRKPKTHPWPNCANYSIPLIDTDINKLKATYVNLAFNVSPVVTFEPYGPEDIDPAKKREMLFDWRLRTQVELFKPYCFGVDQILGSRGMTVFRTIWKFKARTYTETIDLNEYPEDMLDAIYDARVDDELLFRIIQEELRIDLQFDENVEAIEKAIEKFRAGESNIELTLLEIECDRPEVTACDTKDDLVVPMDTKDINDARFIDYKFWVSKNDLKISIRDGKYEDYSDEKLDSWGGKVSDDRNEFPEDMVLLHETCCWHDVNGDGIKERCIATWPDADPESVLRFIELPYDHGMWPYIQVKRELTEDWFYATRGIPSLEEDFQVGISTAVNQAIDNGTITNSPVVVGRKNIISNPRNRRYVPGEYIETNGPTTDYEIRQGQNMSQPVLFQQAQFLKSFSDNRLGSVGGLGGQSDLPGQGERGKKTAKEVEALVAQQGQAQSLDLQVFQQQMAKLYYQIDALYYQFGSDEEHIAITGKPPIKVSRGEIQGKFNMVPNGRLDNATPAMRLQKKMFAFNIGFQNPFVKQRELLKEIYEDIDPRLAQLLLKTEEELAQEQQQQMMMQEQFKQQAIQEQIGLRKVSDDLDIRKEALLTPITGRKHAGD